MFKQCASWREAELSSRDNEILLVSKQKKKKTIFNSKDKPAVKYIHHRNVWFTGAVLLPRGRRLLAGITRAKRPPQLERDRSSCTDPHLT